MAARRGQAGGWALGFLAGLATACGGTSAPPPTTGATVGPPVPGEGAPTVVAPAAMARAPRVAGLWSLPRADWPCGYHYDYNGDGHVDSTCRFGYGARARCLHQPDAWFPGCPTEATCVTDDGNDFVVSLEYDAADRVTAVRENGEAFSSTWSDDSSTFEKMYATYRVGDGGIEVEDLAADSREFERLGRIELDAAGRPVRDRRWYRSGAPSRETTWSYEGPRVTTRRSRAVGDLWLPITTYLDECPALATDGAPP